MLLTQLESSLYPDSQSHPLWREFDQNALGKVGPWLQVIALRHCCRYTVERRQLCWLEPWVKPVALASECAALLTYKKCLYLTIICYFLWLFLDLARPDLGRRLKKCPAKLIWRSPFYHSSAASLLSCASRICSCVQQRKYTIGLNDKLSPLVSVRVCSWFMTSCLGKSFCNLSSYCRFFSQQNEGSRATRFCWFLQRFPAGSFHFLTRSNFIPGLVVATLFSEAMIRCPLWPH